MNLICISEHWLKQKEISTLVPNNFTPASVIIGRNSRKNCGVYIYVENSIQYSVVDVSIFYLELDFEVCFVKLAEENIFVVSIYRSPSGDVNNFLDRFEHVAKKLLTNKHKLIIAGDFNIKMGITNKDGV